MKDNTINIRTSEEDQANIKQAAENLSILTDEKPSVSKAIRQGVKILAEQDPTKPELFHVNRKALRDLDVNLEAAQAKLQAIVDEYVKIINTPPIIDKIETWFGSNRSDFLVTKKAILEGHIGSLIFEMCRVKYPGVHFDNIDMPDCDDLLEACNQLIFVPEVDGTEVIYWQAYRIVSGKVELIPDAVEAVRNTFRTWAITPEEKARLATVKKLCDLLSTIKLPNPSMLNIAGFCAYDGEAGVYAPLEWYVKVR
jgi:uncharacterized protein (DUF1778 family)